MYSKYKQFKRLFSSRLILLNPGPTNTSLSTKIEQWIGSDVCHREGDFSNILSELQDVLSQQVYTNNHNALPHTAIMAGSGTTALDAMIASLVEDGVYVINAGKYGARALEIMDTYNIQYNEITSSNMDDLEPSNKVKRLYFVENETTTGEHYSIERMSFLYPNAKFYIDSTSAFGASSYAPYCDRIISVSFCSNKCLQSTPGLGLVVWDGKTKNYKRNYFGDLEKYGKNKLPFTLPTQSVYALREALKTSLENESSFSARRDKLIERFEEIGIQCANKHPSNSIIGFIHPIMKYEELACALRERGIIIYSGIPNVENSFRVSTMSTKFDKEFNRIIEVFNETCLC